MYADVGEISTHTSPAVPSKVKQESNINLLLLPAPELAHAPVLAPATSAAPAHTPALPCQAQLLETYTGVVTRTHTSKMFVSTYGGRTLLFVSSVQDALI